MRENSVVCLVLAQQGLSSKTPERPHVRFIVFIWRLGFITEDPMTIPRLEVVVVLRNTTENPRLEKAA